MANPIWPPSENTTDFSRYMTSTVYVADLQGNSFGRTIYPQSFVVLALMFSELRRAESPGPRTPKKKPTLNRVKLTMPRITGLAFPLNKYSVLLYRH